MGTAGTAATAHPSLDDLVLELPTALFRGFDRKATRQLFARLDASYIDLVRERDQFFEELGRLQELCGELEQKEHMLSRSVEDLTKELESSEQEKANLADQLARARSRWDVELARAQDDLKRELEHAATELSGYRRRELLLADVVSSARSRADATVAEARDEAERLLRQARKRDQQMLRDAERELERIEAERQRLQALAINFRSELAARLSATLDGLSRVVSDDDASRKTS